MAGGPRWALTLYVDGASTSSIHAIETVRHVCDEEFGDDVELEVIDVHQQPTLAERDQIVAVPTLVRRFPARCAASSVTSPAPPGYASASAPPR